MGSRADEFLAPFLTLLVWVGTAPLASLHVFQRGGFPDRRAPQVTVARLAGTMRHTSARFVSDHKKNASSELGCFDFVLATATRASAKLKLAKPDRRSVGEAELHPPFNVNAVDKERLKDSVGPGRRFPFGPPRTGNGNYLWIQTFIPRSIPRAVPDSSWLQRFTPRGKRSVWSKINTGHVERLTQEGRITKTRVRE